MFKKFLLFMVILLFCSLRIQSEEYLYILDDKCIADLYQLALIEINNNNIEKIRDTRGLMLRYELDSIPLGTNSDLEAIYKNIKDIENFLAKIKNPAIIEVHTQVEGLSVFKSLKNWEYSTILANKLEEKLLNTTSRIERSRIRSIGYGEFLPAKNTPNNGGKYLNRVDIIVLCNITGE